MGKLVSMMDGVAMSVPSALTPGGGGASVDVVHLRGETPTGWPRVSLERFQSVRSCLGLQSGIPRLPAVDAGSVGGRGCP